MRCVPQAGTVASVGPFGGLLCDTAAARLPDMTPSDAARTSLGLAALGRLGHAQWGGLCAALGGLAVQAGAQQQAGASAVPVPGLPPASLAQLWATQALMMAAHSNSGTAIGGGIIDGSDASNAGTLMLPHRLPEPLASSALSAHASSVASAASRPLHPLAASLCDALSAAGLPHASRAPLPGGCALADVAVDAGAALGGAPERVALVMPDDSLTGGGCPYRLTAHARLVCPPPPARPR
jgi:hypothetical protein